MSHSKRTTGFGLTDYNLCTARSKGSMLVWLRNAFGPTSLSLSGISGGVQRAGVRTPCAMASGSRCRVETSLLWIILSYYTPELWQALKHS